MKHRLPVWVVYQTRSAAQHALQRLAGRNKALICFALVVLPRLYRRGWGGGGMATLWSMLRDMHAQCPLDGTSETRSVLLRLLKDGFDGAVSISALTRKNER